MIPEDVRALAALAEELGKCSAAVSRCILGHEDRAELADRLAGILAGTQVVQSRLGLDLARIMDEAQRKVAGAR